MLVVVIIASSQLIGRNEFESFFTFAIVAFMLLLMLLVVAVVDVVDVADVVVGGGCGGLVVAARSLVFFCSCPPLPAPQEQQFTV